MTIKGIVKNGVIVLPEEVKLPDGLEVQVEVPVEFASVWDENEWQKRANALKTITAIGRGDGGTIGRRKHEYLAEIYGSERANVTSNGDETGSVR